MQLLKWFNSNNNIENKYFVDECLVMQVMLEKRKYKNNKKREIQRMEGSAPFLGRLGMVGDITTELEKGTRISKSGNKED